MTEERYVIGAPDIPQWCERWLMPYRKMNGATGVVYSGKRRDFDLRIGDVLILRDDKIEVRRVQA